MMKNMKAGFAVLAGALVLASCAPVLNRELMREGSRDIPLSAVRESPDAYKGKLFILGGVIVETKHTEKGSQVEALAVPVNKLGYLRDEIRPRDGRFLAIFPPERGFLDPLIYKRGREITLAARFIELRKVKLEEVEYTYPAFDIEQVYLWSESQYYPYASFSVYPYAYPYPYGWYDPWWYDPLWRPYPYSAPRWFGPSTPPYRTLPPYRTVP